VIVVDTNLLVNAVLSGAHAEAVRRVARRDPAWVAPALWRIELLNVLAIAMRLRALALPRAVAAFDAAQELVVDAAVEPSATELLELTARGGVSAYDAEFLFVAERLDLVLVSADRKLARAFPERVRSIDEFAAGPA
jgi:predicted nucleic acid-binding protein